MKKIIAGVMLIAVSAIAIWQIAEPSARRYGVTMIVSYKADSVSLARESKISCFMQNCQEAERLRKALALQCAPDVSNKSASFRASGLRNDATQVFAIFSPTSQCQRKRWRIITPLLEKSGVLKAQTSNAAS